MNVYMSSTWGRHFTSEAPQRNSDTRDRRGAKEIYSPASNVWGMILRLPAPWHAPGNELAVMPGRMSSAVTESCLLLATALIQPPAMQATTAAYREFAVSLCVWAISDRVARMKQAHDEGEGNHGSLNLGRVEWCSCTVHRTQPLPNAESKSRICARPSPSQAAPDKPQ